jgi:hypothetical protein
VVGRFTTSVVLLRTVFVVVGPGTLRVETLVTVVGTVTVVLLTTVFVLVFLMISFSISVTVCVCVDVLYFVTVLVCVVVAVIVVVRTPKARASRGLAIADDARLPRTRPLAQREAFIVAEASE